MNNKEYIQGLIKANLEQIVFLKKLQYSTENADTKNNSFLKENDKAVLKVICACPQKEKMCREIVSLAYESTDIEMLDIVFHTTFDPVRTSELLEDTKDICDQMDIWSFLVSCHSDMYFGEFLQNLKKGIDSRSLLILGESSEIPIYALLKTADWKGMLEVPSFLLRMQYYATLYDWNMVQTLLPDAHFLCFNEIVLSSIAKNVRSVFSKMLRILAMELWFAGYSGSFRLEKDIKNDINIILDIYQKKSNLPKLGSTLQEFVENIQNYNTEFEMMQDLDKLINSLNYMSDVCSFEKKKKIESIDFDNFEFRSSSMSLVGSKKDIIDIVKDKVISGLAWVGDKYDFVICSYLSANM